MATIGELFVNLQTNSAAFIQDMGKASRGVATNSAKMTRALGIASISITGVGAGLFLLAKRASKTAGEIGAVADAAGIGTTALQEYRHAAKLSDVTTRSLDGAMKSFNKNLGDLRSGTGTLTTFLQKFDATLADNVRQAGSTEAALDLIFDAMARTANEADRAALSAAAFGAGIGVDMAKMASHGAEGLRLARNEAHSLGLVIEEDLIRGAEQANDQMERLGDVIGIRVTRSLVRLAPAIDGVVTKLLRLVELTTIAGERLFVDPKDQSLLTLQYDLDKVNAELAEMNASVAKARAEGMDFLPDFSIKEAEVARLRELAGALEAMIAFKKKLAEPAPINIAPPPAALDTLEKTVALTDDLSRALEDASRRQADLAISTDRTGELFDEMGRAAGTALRDIRLRAASATDVVRDLANALLQAILQATLISPFQAAVTAGLGSMLSGGTGISPTPGATAGTPFASGGQFTVGGKGGTDANYVPLRLTNKERVTIETPAQQRAGGAQGGSTIFNVDMRGASLEAVQRLEGLVAALHGSIEQRAVTAVGDARRRGYA